MIRHTVVFTLKHPAGSDEERAFLDAATVLAEIPSVRRFERLRQVGKKNEFAFGLSMEFEDEAGYEAYRRHPLHERFVQEWWIPQVADFLEIDYVPYP